MISIVRVLKPFLLCSLFVIACDQPKSEKKGPFLKKKDEITQRPLILFDAFKEQTWSIKDTGFAGYSSLNLFLKNLGYHTEENHRPYKEALAGLGPETLLVIGVAMEAKFTEDEIKSILDFVERGGNVLVIAEHDNKYGSSGFLWQIINAGGWRINNDRVIDHNDALPNTDGRWIRTVLPSKKEGPVFLCAASLTEFRSDVCEVLLTSFDGNNIVAGLGRYKRGHIAILADSEFLWNGNPDYKWEGIYPLAFCDAKTKAFVKDLIFKILPPKAMPRLNDFSFSNKPRSSKRIFVYGNGGDFQNYSKFLAALADANMSIFRYQEGMKITPEDKVIVVSPLKRIPQRVIDDLSKSEKMVIFGDMYSNVKSYAESWKLFFELYEIHPVASPVNALAERYGVRVLPYFGVNFKDNRHGNILYIPVSFRKKRLYLHRACAIELLKGNKNGEVYFENSEETFACGAGFGLNHPLKSMDPNDMKNPDFLVVTDSVFAVGDSDIITDVFFHEAERAGIIDEIVKFLKS
jgi:hypothetical protein